MMFVEIPVALKEAVRNGILSLAEAQMIQKSRDGDAPDALVVVEAAPGSEPISQEWAEKLIASIKDATGAEKVIIMPPGYSFRH